MRTARQILAGIIALALLYSGLPVLNPEDVNRNAKVDLGDAIINVQDFTESADRPETFRSSAERAISTMKVLAGIKSSIGTENETKLKASPFSPHFFYLPTTVIEMCFLESSSLLTEPCLIFQSCELDIQTPPPECA